METQSNAIIEHQIVLDKNDKQSSLVNRSIVHSKSELVESVYGAATCHHYFATETPEVVDSAMLGLMSSLNPMLHFRIGIQTGTEKFWLPWQKHSILVPGADVSSFGSNSGHFVDFCTSDILFKMSRVNKTVARFGTIQDMVQQIADENGVECIIEPTSSQKYRYIQTYQDDVAFIQTRLKPRAVNAKYRGNYYLYVKDNKLHFHTADYGAELKVIDYFRTNGNTTLTEADSSQQLLDEGVSGVRLASYDPYSGEVLEVVSEPGKALKYANRLYPYSKLQGSQKNITYHLSENVGDEVRGIAQSQYDSARQRTYSVAVNTLNAVHVRAGDIVQLVLAQKEGYNSTWAGLYLVSAIAHTLTKGTVSSTFKLQRGEFLGKSSYDKVQIGSKQVEQTNEAEGQSINMAAIGKTKTFTGLTVKVQ